MKVSGWLVSFAVSDCGATDQLADDARPQQREKADGRADRETCV